MKIGLEFLYFAMFILVPQLFQLCRTTSVRAYRQNRTIKTIHLLREARNFQKTFGPSMR